MSAAFKAGREKLPKIQGFDLDRIDVKVGDVVIAPAQALGRQTSGIGGRAFMVEFVASAIWQWERLIPFADTGQLVERSVSRCATWRQKELFAFAKTLKVGGIAAHLRYKCRKTKMISGVAMKWIFDDTLF